MSYPTTLDCYYIALYFRLANVGAGRNGGDPHGSGAVAWPKANHVRRSVCLRCISGSHVSIVRNVVGLWPDYGARPVGAATPILPTGSRDRATIETRTRVSLELQMPPAMLAKRRGGLGWSDRSRQGWPWAPR